jgi:hypothetical protein
MAGMTAARLTLRSTRPSVNQVSECLIFESSKIIFKFFPLKGVHKRTPYVNKITFQNCIEEMEKFLHQNKSRFFQKIDIKLFFCVLCVLNLN